MLPTWTSVRSDHDHRSRFSSAPRRAGMPGGGIRGVWRENRLCPALHLAGRAAVVHPAGRTAETPPLIVRTPKLNWYNWPIETSGYATSALWLLCKTFVYYILYFVSITILRGISAGLRELGFWIACAEHYVLWDGKVSFDFNLPSWHKLNFIMFLSFSLVLAKSRF